MRQDEIIAALLKDGLRWEGHAQKAVELFTSGCNCAQSLFGAFAEECGTAPEYAMRLCSSFGGGMGRLREVCGAVTGAFMVLGLRLGAADPNRYADKAEQYERVQRFAKVFEQRFGSYLCRDLLGLELQREEPAPSERTPEYYLQRPCALYIAYAAALLEQMLAADNG